MDSDIFPVIFLDLFELIRKSKNQRGVCVPPPPSLWLRRFRRPKGLKPFKALRLARALKDSKDSKILRLSAVTRSRAGWQAGRAQRLVI